MGSLMGGRATFLMVIFAFVADFSTPATLAFAITFTEVLLEITNNLSGTLIGLAANNLGSFYTALIMFGLSILSIIYLYFLFSDVSDFPRRHGWNSFGKHA